MSILITNHGRGVNIWKSCWGPPCHYIFHSTIQSYYNLPDSTQTKASFIVTQSKVILNSIVEIHYIFVQLCSESYISLISIKNFILSDNVLVLTIMYYSGHQFVLLHRCQSRELDSGLNNGSLLVTFLPWLHSAQRKLYSLQKYVKRALNLNQTKR